MLVSFNEEDTTKLAFVDFRIRSDILDPVVLTKEIGYKPTRAWARDEEYIGKTMDPKTKKVSRLKRKKPWGMWAIDTGELMTSKRVEEHALFLLDILEPKKDKINNYLKRKNQYVISFYIRWEPVETGGSYEVASKTLRRMTSLCHYFEFNFLDFRNSK